MRNPVTKTEIEFLQTSKSSQGKILEMITRYQGHSVEPTAHYHPNQDELFSVLNGELTVRVNGNLQVLTTGQSIRIPKGQVHSMWNNSDQMTEVNWRVFPAMNTEHLFEILSGLATDGKTNNKGMPHILQVALLIPKYHNVFRLSKPQYILQRLIFLVLRPFAHLRGFRSYYPEYID